MVPQDEGLRGGRRSWVPRAVPLVLIAGALAVLLASRPEGDSAPSTTAAWEGPFGPALDGALAYVGVDRVLYLIDLRDGSRLGSKGIPNDRRPAAVSPSHAYLGRLSSRSSEANWDHWRALPWDGTAYADLGPGNWMAYAPEIGGVVAAMAPLPDGGNGVRLLGEAPLDLARSAGTWGALVPVGEAILARELTAEGEAWWRLAPGEEPRPMALPPGFRPAAGGPGRVAGWVGERAVVASLDTGEIATLAGPLSAAADWDPAGRLLTVATSAPPRLVAYDAAGARVWQTDLDGPVWALRFGVAWSPDGSFLVVAEGGSLTAFTADGARLGRLDPMQPRPETAAAWVEVLALPGP